MKNREHIVGRVHAVNRPSLRLRGDAGTQWSLHKVHLLPRLDVVHVDGDEVIPVRPVVLVHEAQSVEQLVDHSG